MQQLKSCGVFIYRGDPIESFLLMKHAKRWDLPKGHVDAGESEMQCALRELEEETGITAAGIEIDETFRFAHDYVVWPKRLNGAETNKTLVIFLARLTRDAEIVVTEHVGFEWHEWSPPHQIQLQTIDPLLADVEAHFASM